MARARSPPGRPGGLGGGQPGPAEDPGQLQAGPAQGGARVVQVRQDQPAHQGVDRGRHGDLGQLLDDEGDVAEVGVAGPPPGRRDRLGRPVRPEVQHLH
jgi:hypothetical protein